MLDNVLIELIGRTTSKHFAGNMVCRDCSLDCQPLCSDTCWSRNILNDGICDITCNSEIVIMMVAIVNLQYHN